MKSNDNWLESPAGKEMLILQVEELQAQLEIEKEAHRKASSRATQLSKRNASLKEKLEDAEGDLGILASCMRCPDLGNSAACKKCTNSAVFVEDKGGELVWRGTRK